MHDDSSADTVEDDPSSSPHRGIDRALRILIAMVLLAALLAVFVLVYRVLMTDTTLGIVTTGAVSTESAALIRANERIVQLVQWTVSTVLVVAGGLLGLNWYQNQKRYEDDKSELAEFQKSIVRRYKHDHDVLMRFRSEIDVRVRKTESAQEQLAEQHRSHLLVQAVDELVKTDSVPAAWATIMSWYGQIREADNSRQERALSLVWQGFEFIEELIVERGAEPTFFTDDPESESRFYDFLAGVVEAYPEVEPYAEFFRSIALESADK